jgi:hypothetical protein
LAFKLLHLIATAIDACGRQPGRGPGHPPTETIRVVSTLWCFLRQGTPWRGLIATEDQASRLTLRRYLARWADAHAPGDRRHPGPVTLAGHEALALPEQKGYIPPAAAGEAVAE